MEKMNEKIKKTLGFTLIEILVVLAIIGLLAAAAGANYMTSLKQGRDGRRKADLEQIRSALEMYRADNGDYPPLPGGVGWCTQISNPAWPQVKNALEPTYIQKVPQDPHDDGTYKDYVYRKVAVNQYKLYAELEISEGSDDITLASCARIGGTDNEYDYTLTNP